jgi:hypothetical protein
VLHECQTFHILLRGGRIAGVDDSDISVVHHA